MNRRRRIAILTGGGDCPGINAVIRAVTTGRKHRLLERWEGIVFTLLYISYFYWLLAYE